MILISELFGESLWTSCCFMGRHSKVFSVDVRSLTIVLCKRHLSAWFSLYQMLCSTSTVSLLKIVLEADVRKTHLWLNFIIPHYRVKPFMAETLHVRDGESTGEINKLKSWECLCLPFTSLNIQYHICLYMKWRKWFAIFWHFWLAPFLKMWSDQRGKAASFNGGEINMEKGFDKPKLTSWFLVGEFIFGFKARKKLATGENRRARDDNRCVRLCLEVTSPLQKCGEQLGSCLMLLAICYHFMLVSLLFFSYLLTFLCCIPCFV